MALWTLDKIEWQKFNPSLVDAKLLRLAKGASLVESNADDYVEYLTNVFRDDEKFCAEIRTWGDEEKIHGEALARWVKMADPSFDFEEAFEKFRKVQPIQTEAQSSIRGSRSRELVARCMVETGTAAYYAALSDASQEPVFKQICRFISADEVHHYKLFHKTLGRYIEADGLRFWSRLKTVLERSIEVEDAELSLAYACGNYPERRIQLEDHKQYVKEFMTLVTSIYQKRHLDMMAKLTMNAAGIPNRKWISKAVSNIIYLGFFLRQRAKPVEVQPADAFALDAAAAH